jgi:hypothetical protein
MNYNSVQEGIQEIRVRRAWHRACDDPVQECLEDLRKHSAFPEHFQELPPGQDANSLMHPGKAFVANDQRFGWAVFPDKRLQRTQIGTVYSARPLYLDRDFATAQNEIYFQTGLRPPEI